MQQGYTGQEVCKITGISYRQLDHWTSTGLINAAIRNIKGSGFVKNNIACQAEFRLILPEEIKRYSLKNN